MKIAIVEMVGKGGMIHYAFQLARALADEGNDVTLVTDRNFELAALPAGFRVEKPFSLWDPKAKGGGAVVRKMRRLLRAARYYGAWLRLWRYLARRRFDVVQFGDIRFPGDLVPLMLIARLPVVLADVCHNVRPYTAGGTFSRSPIRGFFYRRIYRLFDPIFVHFERNRSEFLSAFDVPAERVCAIVHGNEEIFEELRDPEWSAERVKREIGVEQGQGRLVLFFGTLSRYKGVDVLLEAFAAADRRPGDRLAIAGFVSDDFDLEAHRALATRLAIERDVVWIPRYLESGEVAAWMEAADLVVFPYRSIYQSGALAVALTFGRPIVATDTGAFRDVIDDRRNGLLVPPGDAGRLAEAIGSLLHNDRMRSVLGGEAARDARSRFAWSRVASEMLEVYRRGQQRAAGQPE